MRVPVLPPLDPELVALIAAEREAAAPGPALDRVWSRVARSVGPVADAEDPSSALSHAAPRGLTAAARNLAVATFVAGGVTGAVIHAMWVRRPVALPEAHRPPSVAPVVPVQSSAEPPTPEVDRVEAKVPPPRTHVPVGPPPAPTPSAASSLAAERAILDRARASLASNDGKRALALTEDHARRYPLGLLGEEREAIAIQALVLEGRYDEARARAARFEARSPNSLFHPAVEATLESIP
ncbi:MAG TPA: hypothetical protein VKU41_31635 [Polyangiaceae bacterium]|nr:hypothetical protein [Polyangiaceae bacterium]